MPSQFSTIDAAVEAIAAGRAVIVVDAEDRENEGDFICAADKVTPEIVNFMITHGRGQLCMPILPEIRSSSINAMTDVPVAIEIEANPVFDNLVFESTSDNGFDAIGILGGTLTGSNLLSIRAATLGVTPIDNLTYILLSDITIAGGMANWGQAHNRMPQTTRTTYSELFGRY